MNGDCIIVFQFMMILNTFLLTRKVYVALTLLSLIMNNAVQYVQFNKG
jgi:hypothetical protein